MSEQLDSILGIGSQQKLRHVTCSKCSAPNEPDAEFCTGCGQALAIFVPPPPVRKPASSEDLQIVSSMMSRYKDGYLVANATTGFGSLIKGLGVVLASLIALVTLSISGQTRGSGYGVSEIFVMLVGLFWAVVVGFLFYLLGVLISAQGQILKASLDGAVNGSPFLGNEEKAKVMSLL
ncbi:MAG TPA: zinc ribbon domain-containing protein [Blastocatellia bacterium]|nr:zinc ribbon domain-containing protein [Blastocatellia bacterium]HMV84154.1 zinc ribbon domain-containing protein [Blastocatellia bacterium]HMX29127.1 zinc ribbon domain-containing protein [Blastocatellia bacterium]HMY73266.1 zinc ribbon domain-containing protein [Blastocatellia bacterium]HMZ19081.1 zinc ribbon domain-containing protein [Blastocatellia bacterium]